MSNAIGFSSESNPSRRICHLRAALLGHVADLVLECFVLLWEEYFLSCVILLYIKSGLFLFESARLLARFAKTIGYNTDTLTSFYGIDNVFVLRMKG